MTVRYGAFDPDTLDLLRATLDKAWERLRPDQQARLSKATLAERILNAAGAGERDPRKLMTAALGEAASEEQFRDPASFSGNVRTPDRHR